MTGKNIASEISLSACSTSSRTGAGSQPATTKPANPISALSRSPQSNCGYPLSTRPRSLNEAMQANPGSVRLLSATDGRDALLSYRQSPNLNLPARLDQMELVSWLCDNGGIRDQRGELSHMGNRVILSSPNRKASLAHWFPMGYNLDDAAQASWERVYFGNNYRGESGRQGWQNRHRQDGQHGRHPARLMNMDAIVGEFDARPPWQDQS